MASICCSPPDSPPAFWSRRSARRGKTPNQVSRSSLDLVRPHVRADAEVVLDGEVGERSPALGHLGDAVAHDGVGAGVADVVPGHRDRTSARDRARDGPDRRGLAGAVGTEDDDHLALVDLQVQPVQHLDRPVAGVEIA